MGQSGEGEVVRASQGRSVIWSDAVNLGVLEELQAGWVFDAVVSSFYAERGLYNSKGGGSSGIMMISGFLAKPTFFIGVDRGRYLLVAGGYNTAFGENSGVASAPGSAGGSFELNVPGRRESGVLAPDSVLWFSF